MTAAGWIVWYVTGFLFHCALAEIGAKALGKWSGYLAPTVIGSLFWPIVLPFTLIPAKGETFWPRADRNGKDQS